MAYDQGYYQPSQRPYNGRAAQPPGPAQGYSQPPPQQYPPQQYDQYPQEYPQDGYGYDDYNNGSYDYNNGYGQEYDGGYHDMNGGGRGNGYPPTNQSYPPRQEHYGSGRGGAPGGGAPRGPPMQRGPPPDGGRGRYDGGQGRDYPAGGPAGRGGRPGPLERAAISDPGLKAKPRKPLKTPPRSPNQPTWDNPFPTFPGAKKKTSVSEEQKLVDKMANVEVGDSPQNRPRTNGSKSSQDRYPNGQRGAPAEDYGHPMDNPRNVPPPSDYGRPSGEGQRRGPPPDEYGRQNTANQRRAPPDNYGRPSAESQGNMPPRAYPPQGAPQPGPQDSRRGPSDRAYGQSWDSGHVEPSYNDGGAYEPELNLQTREGFGPPGRSMTVPMEKPVPTSRQAPSAPYNGPIGRGGPQRPSTATGSRPPQRAYQSQAPQQDPYPPDRGQPPRQAYSGHQPGESIDAVFDSYYDEAPADASTRNARPLSASSEMPNFEALAAKPVPYRRGNSIDEHIRPDIPHQNSYSQELKPAKSQPDFHGRAQPQAAVFEMAGAPPLPNAMPPQGYDDGYGQEPSQQGYGQYRGAPPQNNSQQPPRSASAAPRTAPSYGGGLPNGPRPGLAGLPKGPSPQGGGPIRANTMPRPSPSGPDSLPSHPPPVRAGLIPNSVANLASNKPPPVRNYNNMAPMPQQPNPGQVPAQQAAAPQTGAAPAPPVTAAELEQLRNSTKMNPNDQATQLLLAQKLVEASKVLVESIPDQRTRNKTRERYVMDAHKLLKKLVQGQNVDAMFFLADCHGSGELGLENDAKEAFTLYQSAAKAGHAAAAYRTAVCCELGNDQGGGTRKDPLKAMQWYKRAATLGDTPAMYKMGMILLKGLLGQPKNPREAVGWLKRAAERADAENPHALHELGLLFEQPQSADSSILRDEAYSFQLFQEAANLGYKFSQFRLGCAYEYGLFNCPIDPRQSIMWYSKAADQGEHQSELALSGWYLTGSEGVLQQSDSQAYLWARKAAIAELTKAEYAMGYFTEVGIGTLANLEDAKRWYWRAAAQNFPKARERLEDLKRGGAKGAQRPRERISRSKVGKQNEGECSVM